MPSHKFKVGDIVTINPAISGLCRWCLIIQLPGDNEPEYRIKSANEPQERVTRESELDLAPRRCPVRPSVGVNHSASRGGHPGHSATVLELSERRVPFGLTALRKRRRRA
jgi:hypothetical protein